MNTKPEYLSLSQVARRLDLNQRQVRKASDAGLLVPDLVCGRLKLFDPARLPKLKVQLLTLKR